MKIIALIGLLLTAGAASAQQPTAAPQAQLYRDESGRLLVRKVPRRAAPLAGGSERAAAGRYRAEPYALRVQVPPPHPDSVAVVGPGQRPADDLMPRQPLPPVKLLPEGRKLQ